jgi:hypothetical protein
MFLGSKRIRTSVNEDKFLGKGSTFYPARPILSGPKYSINKLEQSGGKALRDDTSAPLKGTILRIIQNRHHLFSEKIFLITSP